MTFLEAAIEILRGERDPLHFAEITKRAVDRKLLSHVGRDPETAMQTCLNSAVRNNIYDGLLLRDKPGHFQLRPGAALPELPPPPSARPAQALPLGGGEKQNDSNGLKDTPSKPPKLSVAPPPSSGRGSGRGGRSESGQSRQRDSDSNRQRDTEASGRRKKASRPAPAPNRSGKKAASPVVMEKVVGRSKKASSRPAADFHGAAEPNPGRLDEETDIESMDPDRDDGDDGESGEFDSRAEPIDESSADEAERRFAGVSDQMPSVPMPALDPSKIRFRGPDGSGLEGDTDIALVMANAVSRLVEERPELREELEAMQRPAQPEVIVVGGRTRFTEARPPRREERHERKDEPRDKDEPKDGQAMMDDDRGGRRRRRRRRRPRRVEWSEGGPVRAAGNEELLDKVAIILADAGARSLHVRQIAENLANQNVLGGEISEIERAVTAALLLDVHRRGDASRFGLRGDARYQLRGSRVPEKAALAEHAARRALLALEQESEKQLLLWLQALGARSLETVARMWLDREDHTVLATLAPARGLGKLIVEDPEADDQDGRVLVLLVPRKAAIEPKVWEGEAERNECGSTLVFAMGEAGSDLASADTRVIGASELARWLIRQRIGVRIAHFEVAVLDADLIESIAGLDT